VEKTRYEDYKYAMQDTASLYVGSKYTFGEILEDETIYFKFRLLVNQHILTEADREDTIETHLYYLDEKSFLVKIYKQLKGKVKVNLIEEKKSLFGKKKKQYCVKTMKVEELVKMTAKQKEAVGLVVMELQLSKLALMTF